MDFIHLHAHSSYSLLQGALGLGELIGAAAGAGMAAVALTDTNGLYGALAFYEAARQAGLKPIVGAELVHGAEQCVLLAADRRGYANLCRIVTERRLAGTPHYADYLLRADATEPKPGTVSRRGRRPRRGLSRNFGGQADTPERVPPADELPAEFDLAESIAADPRGLFALTATPSLLRRLHGRLPEGRLYAELRADEPRSFETRCPALRGEGGPAPSEGRATTPDVADRLGIPPVATVNVNFLRPQGRHTHAVLGAVRENADLKAVLEDGRLIAGPRSRFLAAGQVAARLPAAARGEAMRNTVRIAEQCNLEMELGVPHFPRADLAAGLEPCEQLRRLAVEGARRRYGRLTDAVRRRLERELKVIEKLGFCDYFLVVRDIVAFAERERIPHVGRGSAANSIVSYALGISAVDPLKFDLYFERFLNEFRTDVPDIDIDFCWRRRDEVIDYVYGRYPKGQVAMVATHSTFRARSAFRDVARVMGIPRREIDALSKKLPCHAVAGIEEAVEAFPELSDFPIQREPWRGVLEQALAIDGYVRHLGIHLGGMVIGDRPLTWYAPLEESAKGIVVTQYEMESIERAGLVKIDLLGQRSLSIVDEAARSVERLRGAPVDLERLPDRDPRTATLLRNGRTMGCFQIESPGMRQLLQMLGAESIMDLIQALSLIRPGPSSSGMKHAFVRRRRGEEPVRYPTPLMEEALAKTCGVMLYQEDILRVAQAVAGFSLAEGDELRKYISKQRSREKLLGLKDQFVGGAVERGVEPRVAEQIWSQVESFAAYSYCKAHASTYGHISYQASYLKAHWPAEFLASVVANKAGFYDPRTYMAEARRFNVRVLPPCVSRSDVETRPELDGAEAAIRPGLELVKALSRTVMKRILAERARRPFASLEDFCARVRLTRPELENLILGGAFDAFGPSRPTLMLKAERLLSRPERIGAAAWSGAGRLLESTREYAVPVEVPELPPYPLSERVLYELQVLGFSHCGHPLDAWNEEPKDEVRSLKSEVRPRVASYQLARHVGRSVTIVGWLVTTRRAVTRNRQYMKFLTLEDRHGVTEVVIFPDVYRRCGRRIGAAGCYRATGTVKEQHGAVSLVAEDVAPLPLR